MNFTLRVKVAKFIMPIALSGFISMTTVSCKKSSVSNPANSAVSNFSGEEIFSAVFFHEGDAVSKIPILNDVSVFGVHNNDTNIIKAKREILSDLINCIKALDPQYFIKLKKTIQSGDYSLISDEMNSAGNVIVQAGLTSKKYGQYYKSAMNAFQKIDISKYDLKSEQGKKSFADAVSAVLKGSQSTTNKADGGSTGTANSCIAAVVVVGVFIWEGAVIVNVVAIAAVAAVAAAVVKVVGLQSIGSPLLKGTIQNDALISQLAENFN